MELRLSEAAEIANNSKESFLIWCKQNVESDWLLENIEGAIEVKGSESPEAKEEKLLAFANGEIKKLITKPKITSFGLNWQHCNHTVYFPTFSYEQYYQAIRRFWRFGQKREVIADIVYSDGQEKVLQSLIAKAEKAGELFSSLNASINSTYTDKNKEFNKPVTLPTFIKGAA